MNSSFFAQKNELECRANSAEKQLEAVKLKLQNERVLNRAVSSKYMKANTKICTLEDGSGYDHKSLEDKPAFLRKLHEQLEVC
jgi:hypothetical protein